MFLNALAKQDLNNESNLISLRVVSGQWLSDEQAMVTPNYQLHQPDQDNDQRRQHPGVGALRFRDAVNNIPIPGQARSLFETIKIKNIYSSRPVRNNSGTARIDQGGTISSQLSPLARGISKTNRTACGDYMAVTESCTGRKARNSVINIPKLLIVASLPQVFSNQGMAYGGLTYETAALTDYDNLKGEQISGNRNPSGAKNNGPSRLSNYQANISADSYNRGNRKLISGDARGAILEFNKAISLDGKNYKAYINRANAKRVTGDHVGAIDDFSRAIAIRPDYSNAYYGRGNSKLDLGDLRGAIDDFALSLKYDDNQVLAVRNMALAYQKLGDMRTFCLALKLAVDMGDTESREWLQQPKNSWCQALKPQ